MPHHLLFNTADLRSVIENQKRLMAQEIDALPPERVLTPSIEDLVTYFTEKYGVEPIALLEDQLQVDQREVRVDVRNDPLRWIPDRSDPVYIPGTEVTLYVPFQGDPELFKCWPSSFTLSPPRGNVDGNTLQLSVRVLEHDAAQTKAQLDRLLADVRGYANTIREDLAPLNKELPNLARQSLIARKQKLLDDHGLAASLGYPLRPRSGAPPTYVSPELRRKPSPKLPRASTEPYKPEPAISLEEYDNIIVILKQTASMLERSPDAFRHMDEQNLRNQFLVPLNSHYEGQATGETFNLSGKTDILVRDGDRSVFVAECKIWRGSKSLSDAIDQLLSYATWRDSKAAILIFNRNKGFTAVLHEIPDVCSGHPSFRRAIQVADPAEYRFVASHASDPAREILVSVLGFDVPG